MVDASEMLADEIRRRSGGGPVVVKGKVEHVDTSGTYDLVTVNGRHMRTLGPVAVGDDVAWIDHGDPICLGEFYATP